MKIKSPIHVLVRMWAMVFVFVGIQNVQPQIKPAEPDPTVDVRVRHIAAQLIAPCCWSQTVDVHHSEIAETMIARIRNELLAGKGEDDIVAMFVSEYGERVLAIPKPKGVKSMLWIIPAIVLLVGAAIVVRVLKRQTKLHGTIKTVNNAVIDSDTMKKINDELHRIES